MWKVVEYSWESGQCVTYSTGFRSYSNGSPGNCVGGTFPGCSLAIRDGKNPTPTSRGRLTYRLSVLNPDVATPANEAQHDFYSQEGFELPSGYNNHLGSPRVTGRPRVRLKKAGSTDYVGGRLFRIRFKRTGATQEDAHDSSYGYQTADLGGGAMIDPTHVSRVICKNADTGAEDIVDGLYFVRFGSTCYTVRTKDDLEAGGDALTCPH